MADMRFFEGASHITVNGDVTSNTTSGHYINKSQQNVTNNYGAQNVSQTNYVNSNNDYSSHHHHTNYGPQTTVNNVNSNNTTQTSYVNSNNDNSNTMYGGDWRDYPQYPQQQGPPQGWPPRGQGQDHNPYRSHPGMTQYDPQARGYPTGGQFDPNQSWGPDHAGSYQQQDYPNPKPSKRPHRTPNDFGFEHYQKHSYSEAEFHHHQHLQHVQPRPASFHAAPAPNSSSYNPNYTADLQQQRFFEQSFVPQANYPTPSAQEEDWAESSDSTSAKGSKTRKERQRDKDRKGKKPQRATVETTDDEDDDPPARSKDGEREKMVNETLGPVLEKISDTDDDFGDLLKAPPPRTIRPASVPVQSTSMATAASMATSTQGTASQQRPNTTAPVAATSQSAIGRPVAAATALNPLTSASTSTPAPAASTSNVGRVPTQEEELQAQLAISRISSALSSGDEGKDKKKKKKGVFSRIKVFGKKKEKGGVVGLEDIG